MLLKKSKWIFVYQKTNTLVKTIFFALKKVFGARIKSLAQNVSYTILFQYQYKPDTYHFYFWTILQKKVFSCQLVF